MKLIDIINNADDELKLEEYLTKLGLLKSFTNCPFCSNDKFGVVRRNKLKCYRCKREWSKRKDSPIENVSITSSKVLLYYKMRSLNISEKRIGIELNLNWYTMKKVRNKLKNEGWQIVNQSG